MKIKSSDGRVINVPANFQAKAKALMEAGNHSGMEALYNEIESQSFKKGGMLKRKDGSYSRRGLWDNIRANRGSGKKPTKQMLEQERKIRAKHAAGGTIFKGYVTEQPISNAVPWHSSTIHEEGGYTEGPNIGELGPTKLSSSLWEAPYSDAGLGYIFGETPRYPMPLPTNMQQKAIEAQGLYNTPGDVNSLVDRRYINPLKSGDAYDDLYYDAGLSRAESEKGMQYLSDTYGERSPQRFQYGKGGYTVKRSSARKGKTHVVIGPDGTKKYFGDSKLGQHPGNPKRKKAFYARHAKNLKGNPYFRAFARATWADGGKLGEGIYDMGLMPYGMGGHLQEGPHSYLENPYLQESVDLQYADGGYIFSPKMNYDGTIRGADTPAYNEREKMGFGGLFKQFKENKGFLGDLARNPGQSFKDIATAGADLSLSTVGSVTNIKSLKDAIGPNAYKSGGLKGIDNFTSGAADVLGTATKFVPITAPFAAAAGAAGGLANNAFGIDKRNYHPEWHQSEFEKATGTLKQAGDFAGMFYNPVAAAGNLGKAAQVASQIGKYAGLGNMGLNIGQQLSSGQGINPMQLLQLGMSAGGLGIFGGGNQGGGNNPATSNINMSGQPGDIGTQGQGMFEFPSAKYGGYVRMDDGGQTGMVPINVEGGNFSEGSGPDARKGELLVLNGKIIKNYVGRPPHPAEGQNPMGDDEAPEGLIVIPKNRTKEYLEAGLQKRQQMERSLVSQQQHREMKKSRMMGDGGYYSFGMGDMGMGEGGPIGNPETINDITYGTMKKGGWIQKATASIKRRGTEGVCTGSKFGSSSCPPGSRRYNLAKTFRKMAKARNHEHGGFVDPVTGSHTVMYGNGGQLPEGLLRTRMRASGASQQEINDYVAAKYEMGGATNVIHDFPIRRLRYDDQVVTSGDYTNVGEYNDFLNSTFQANNPYYTLPTNFSGNPTPIQIPARPSAQAPALNTSGINEYADWQNALYRANPGLGAQSSYVAPSTMLAQQNQRAAASQRAGNIVNQKQMSQMVSAPPATYYTTPTNPYSLGSSGARATSPMTGTPISTGYMPGTRRSSGPNTATRPVNKTVATPVTRTAAAPVGNAAPIIGAPSTTSPYAAGVQSPQEYASSLGWNTPSYNYSGPGSYASWGPAARQSASYPTSTFSDFLNSDQSNSPVMTGANGYDYSVNPNASPEEVSKFLNPTTTQGGQANWGNILNDAMRLAPLGVNLAAALSKRQYMKPEDYMQQGLRFKGTKFDRTPYETARSRGIYALRQAGAGPGYKAAVGNLAAQLGQQESMGRMAHTNQEILREQQLDAMNLGVTEGNINRRFAIADKNRQIRAAGQNAGVEASNILGQIGAENEYLNVIGGRNPRKMFTDWTV